MNLEGALDLEPLERGSEEWYRVLGANLPKVKVTDETRRVSSLMALRGYRSGFRVAEGRYMTDEEHEALRRKVLATSMESKSFCDKYLPIFTRIVRYLF